MKKSFLVVLFVMLAASMFAADLSVTLEAGVLVNKGGLYARPAQTTDESEYTGAFSVAYDGESFGGMMEFRTEASASPYAYVAATKDNFFFVRGYQVYVKPCQEVKLSIDTCAYELLAENISWEPLHAASIFECTQTPHVVVTWDVDAHLQIIAGIDTTLTDRRKVWTGAGALATYEVFGLGKFIGKFEFLDEKLDTGATWDAGLAFQLLALDTQDVYAGYSLIMNKLNPVQHRIEAFYGLNLDALTFSFFDSLEIKTENDTVIGNRAALKVAYTIDSITPSLAINYYHNFGGGGHIWGAPDISSDSTTFCDIINIDPRVSFAFGQGTLSTGARVTLDLLSGGFSWYIPLGISVSL